MYDLAGIYVTTLSSATIKNRYRKDSLHKPYNVQKNNFLIRPSECMTEAIHLNKVLINEIF